MNTPGHIIECAICGKRAEQYGNNAWPVIDGICCDECNKEQVIPARIAMYYKQSLKHIS